MATSVNRAWSLEALENDYWKAVDAYPSNLIERCYQYRKIPLNKLSIEELRTLIGQQIGLDFLLPLAFEHLEKDILAEGDFYPGDLLAAVLRTDKVYWASHKEYDARLKKILAEKAPEIDNTSLLKDIAAFEQRGTTK